MVSNADTLTTPNGEKPADAFNATKWEDIDFQKAEEEVRHLQRRISKAYKEGRKSEAKSLCYLLVHSRSARILAVRRVSQLNKGKHTPGVDGELWLTDEQKLDAVERLNQGPYRAEPLRRIYIPKRTGKMRPLSIPTMYDRAMQALYALALDPIQEATADPNSYGFRLGRSCQDAKGQIQILMASSRKPQWVLEGDIKSCFDMISHKWLMDNIPMDKHILKEFISAGFIFKDTLFPTESGTPQGGVISPILANMTLNGMEPLIKQHFPKANTCRFADDFVVVLDSPETAEKVKDLLSDFLAIRGLELSPEKTLTTHIDDGFNFLGWNFQKHKNQNRKILIIRPSDDSLDAIKNEIRDVVMKHGLAKSQDEIIEELNPKVRGWCNYHCSSNASESFSYLDSFTFRTLFRWGLKRHRNKGKKWVADRYWHRSGNRQWEFCTEDNALFRPIDVKIKRHIKVIGTKNPYIDTEYFRDRQKSRKHERGYRDKRFAM